MNRNRFISIISLVLITIMVTNPVLYALEKSGIILSNEMWEGEITLEGDVVIPADTEVTIKPGTVLLYKAQDVKNYGNDPTLPEFVVYGKLNLPGGMGDIRQFAELNPDSRTRIIKIEPYKVDVTGLREEFHWFSVQYAVLWTLLTGTLVYAIANR